MSVYIHICLHKYIHLDMFMFSLLIWPVWSSSYRTSWSSRLEILSRPVHVTHPLVCRDSFMSVTWLILVGNSVAPCVTWIIHECAVTHSWVWLDIFSPEILSRPVSHDSSMSVPWLIHECDMTHFRQKFWCTLYHSPVSHDSSMSVSHDSSMNVSHDSSMSVTWRIHVANSTSHATLIKWVIAH